MPVISPMGNLPVIKDLVVDMEPFWDEVPRRSSRTWTTAARSRRSRSGASSRRELDRVMKEALCILCGCCVSECNSMEADPDFLGPAALAKAARFVDDVRDRGGKSRLET